MNKKLIDRGKHFFMSLVGLAALLLVWDIAVRFTDLGNLFPSPISVAGGLFQSFYEPLGHYTILIHLQFSMIRVLTGFALGSGVGLLFGLLIGRSQMAEAIVRPLFEIIRPIPSVAWIPMAIIWFGIGDESRIFIIFMAAFANMVQNVYTGARRVDKELIGVAQMLGANGWKTYLYVVLPSCVPFIFAGLHVALATSWMAVLAAEMIAATEGVGFVITAGQEEANMVQVLVGIVVISLVGLLLASIMHKIETILCRWRKKGA